jgi:hypothetical protein
MRSRRRSSIPAKRGEVSRPSSVTRPAQRLSAEIADPGVACVAPTATGDGTVAVQLRSGSPAAVSLTDTEPERKRWVRPA